MKVKVLLLLTRRLDGRRSGRRVVLKTIYDSLVARGHEVTTVCIDRTGTEQGQALRPPRLARVLCNALGGFAFGRYSLNECLYRSPRLVRELRVIVQQSGCELVVADMARTAQLAEKLGLPWIVDLDDLLSRRYEAMATRDAEPAMILGYFAEQLPGWLRRPAAAIAKRLLRREAKLLQRREVYYAQQANATCLVAADEAQTLSQRSGRDVKWMPMSAAIPAQPAPHIQRRPMSAVFMGGLDYQPNLEAVRWYVTEVVPRLHEAGLEDLVLYVMGHVPDGVAEELASPHLKLLGYVDSVADELAAHQVFVAPIVSGTGLKTKVLEAMGAGLPVVGTAEAFKGIGAAHGQTGYIADSGPDFVAHLKRIASNPAEAERVARAGRALVETQFAAAVLASRWDQLLREALN